MSRVGHPAPAAPGVTPGPAQFSRQRCRHPLTKYTKIGVTKCPLLTPVGPLDTIFCAL